MPPGLPPQVVEALTPRDVAQDFCTDRLDDRFRQCGGLTWLPWVGEAFLDRPHTERLLIVGESHYVRPKDGEDLSKVIADHLSYADYTRDVVAECLVYQAWPNRTLDTLPKLLFGTDQIDRERYWSDTAFYNFIQVPMHYNREGSPERPSWEAFVAGWSSFLDVVRILEPSHCLFIGVAALDSFNHSMNELGVPHEDVQWTEQVGRTYGRRASLPVSSGVSTLLGVQHLGKYFSWSRWRDYLQRHHADLIGFIDAGRYTENQEAQQDGAGQPPTRPEFE